MANFPLTAAVQGQAPRWKGTCRPKSLRDSGKQELGPAFKTSCRRSQTLRWTPSCTCWSFPGGEGIHSLPARLPSLSWQCSACRRAGSHTWSCESCKDTAPGSGISRFMHSLHPVTSTLHTGEMALPQWADISSRCFSGCRIADTVFLGFPEDPQVLWFLSGFYHLLDEKNLNGNLTEALQMLSSLGLSK